MDGHSRIAVINFTTDLALKFSQVVNRQVTRHDLASAFDELVQQIPDGSGIIAAWLDREMGNGVQNSVSRERNKGVWIGIVRVLTSAKRKR